MPEVTYDFVETTSKVTSRKFKVGSTVAADKVDYIQSSKEMVFKVSRVTPYLYSMPGDSTKTLAADKCGQIVYKPIATGFDSVVTWTESQINPSSTSTASLEFRVNTIKKEDVGKKTLKISIESKLGTYQPFKQLEIPIEIIGLTNTTCGISLKVLHFKRTDEPTAYKFYKTPYHSRPSDLIEWGETIPVRIPKVNSTCPDKPVFYRISARTL